MMNVKYVLKFFMITREERVHASLGHLDGWHAISHTQSSFKGCDLWGNSASLEVDELQVRARPASVCQTFLEN